MKKKSKPLKITLKVNPKTYRPKVRLTEDQWRELDSVLRREVKNIRQHFNDKNGGWPLAYALIEADIYKDVFGEIAWYVLGTLLKSGASWKHRKNSVGYAEAMLVGPIKRQKRVTK